MSLSFFVVVVFEARRENRDAVAARAQFLRGRLDADGDAVASRKIGVAEKRDFQKSRPRFIERDVFRRAG